MTNTIKFDKKKYNILSLVNKTLILLSILKLKTTCHEK